MSSVQSLGDVDDITYALIHEASSLSAGSSERELVDAVSRSRGAGKVVQQTDTDRTAIVYESGNEGKSETETGYVIRFVDEQYLDLSPFDIIGIDSIAAHSVTQSLWQSLPDSIQDAVRDQGYVKVRGDWSVTDSQFRVVERGWDESDRHAVFDQLADLVEQMGRTPPAVDYFLVVEGPDRYTPETVASIRGIESRSVERHIRDVKRQLNE